MKYQYVNDIIIFDFLQNKVIVERKRFKKNK